PQSSALPSCATARRPANGSRRGYLSPGPALQSGAASAPALLAHPDRDLDRGALETELLAQPALQEPPVAGLEEAAGEQHELRGPGGGLGAEQDPRLLAATHRV